MASTDREFERRGLPRRHETIGGSMTAALVAVLAALPLQLFTGDFLYYGVVFFVLAIVAALLGLRGVAGITMEIARIFIVLFVVLAVIALVL